MLGRCLDYRFDKIPVTITYAWAYEVKISWNVHEKNIFIYCMHPIRSNRDL